jgi:hypothetical protein
VIRGMVAMVALGLLTRRLHLFEHSFATS